MQNKHNFAINKYMYHPYDVSLRAARGVNYTINSYKTMKLIYTIVYLKKINKFKLDQTNSFANDLFDFGDYFSNF